MLCDDRTKNKEQRVKTKDKKDKNQWFAIFILRANYKISYYNNIMLY